VVLVFLGAGEQRNLELGEALSKAQVAYAMSQVGPPLDPTRGVSELSFSGAGPRNYFAVVEPDSGNFLGLVRGSHLEAARTSGWTGSVAALLLPLQLSAHTAASLASLVSAMERMGQEAVPVLFGRTIVGVLSWSDLHRFAMAELERIRKRSSARTWVFGQGT